MARRRRLVSPASDPEDRIEELLKAGAESVRGRTPCFAFFPELLVERSNRVRSAGRGVELFYSLKANPANEVLKILAREGYGADISTVGELQTALEAGFESRNLSCVGPWKPLSFLLEARREGVRRICIESKREAREAREVFGDGAEFYARVLLVGKQSGVAEEMATRTSQFGLLPSEIAQLQGEQDALFDGLHVYSGSDYRSPEAATRVLQQLTDLPAELSALPLQFGPGLGISYIPLAPDPSWEEMLDRARELCGGRLRAVEVGRYLVAHAVVLFITAQIVKRRGGHLVVITDGGMTAFARPLITGARHAIFRADQPVREALFYGPNAEVRITGPTCTPLDDMGGAAYFSDVQEGDLLAVLDAGAYGANLRLDGFMDFPSPQFCVVNTI